MDNVFDFNNLDDVPEELRKGFRPVDLLQDKLVDIIRQGQEAGLESMMINQIMVVAHRMGVALPKPSTVRTKLNNAVTQGLLHKPTNMTYAFGKGQNDQSQPAIHSVADEPERAERPDGADEGVSGEELGGDVADVSEQVRADADAAPVEVVGSEQTTEPDPVSDGAADDASDVPADGAVEGSTGPESEDGSTGAKVELAVADDDPLADLGF